MRGNEFYHFRFRDPRSGKWIRAGFLAQVPVIRRCYAEWEIIGPSERRTVGTGGSEQFNDLRQPVAQSVIAPMLLWEQ
jgi:hypothetical protein